MRPACVWGTCGADDCPRCGAGDEVLFVPQPLPRGPRPAAPPVSPRLRELRERADARGLTTDEHVERDRLEDEAAFIQAEREGDERARYAEHMRAMVARYGEARILERTGWSREEFARAMAGENPRGRGGA